MNALHRRLRQLAILVVIASGAALSAPAIASAATPSSATIASTPSTLSATTSSARSSAQPKNRVRGFRVRIADRVGAERDLTRERHRGNYDGVASIASGSPLAAKGGQTSIRTMTSAELKAVRGGAMSRKAALTRLEGLSGQVETHLGKLAENPMSRAAGHWRSEISTWLRDMERVVPAVGKKTGASWMSRIGSWREALGQ